jgi:hypothetical protein
MKRKLSLELNKSHDIPQISLALEWLVANESLSSPASSTPKVQMNMK